MDATSLLPAALGGLLIGLSAALLLVLTGRIAGISGILAGLVLPEDDDPGWRVAFLLGLASGGVGLAIHAPGVFDPPAARQLGPLGLVAAGLLVGFGARLANGCTSGHGVCGISRGARRSFLATAIFIAAGMLTVRIMGHP